MKATKTPIIEEGKNVPYIKTYDELGFCNNPHNGYYTQYPTTDQTKERKVSSYKVGGGNSIQLRDIRKGGQSKAIRHLTNHVI